MRVDAWVDWTADHADITDVGLSRPDSGPTAASSPSGRGLRWRCLHWMLGVGRWALKVCFLSRGITSLLHLSSLKLRRNKRLQLDRQEDVLSSAFWLVQIQFALENRRKTKWRRQPVRSFTSSRSPRSPAPLLPYGQPEPKRESNLFRRRRQRRRERPPLICPVSSAPIWRRFLDRWR